MATTTLTTVTQCVVVGDKILVVYSGPDPAKTAGSGGFKVENPLGASPVGFPKATTFTYDDRLPGTIILPPSGFLKSGSPFKVTVNTSNVSGSQIGVPQEPIVTVRNFDTKADAATKAVGDVATAVGNASTGVVGAIGDATSYPFLTEEVSLGRSPSSTTSGSAGGTSSLAQTVGMALQQVLGWKVRNDDPKGFVGALTQSFSCKEIEGHVECTWTPRSYAVQTDLAGGITGAQASIYARAKEAVDQALPLLDGLYPLRPDADKEFIEAARSVVRSQSTALVEELGIPGGPRPSRIDQIFLLLLGPDPTITDPDTITGELATLRVQLGLRLTIGPGVPPEPVNLANSVEDEQDQTNFRIIVDYLSSLRSSWENNKQFFTRLPGAFAFFGTQLVLLSRQLSVVAETVQEVRFTLDSVFIGPSERQTLPLTLKTDKKIPIPSTTNIFLEEFLSWVDSFASSEGPGLIQEGGKFAVKGAFAQIAVQLQIMAADLPTQLLGEAGFRTARVQRALAELASQLQVLVDQTTQIQLSPF
jgi:hypothetical protein